MRNIAVLRLFFVALALVGITCLRPAHAQGGNPNPALAVPYNAQYPELSAHWWRWVLEQPASTNPNLDPTGARAHNGQPANGNIFFLGGSFGASPVERWITIPPGKRLFFPVLNAWSDILGTPPGTTIADLRSWAAWYAEHTTELHASIDGVPLTGLFGYRTISPVFSYTLPLLPDNIIWYLYAFPAEGEVYPTVADGYYLLLNPLMPGEHTVNFGGLIRDDAGDVVFELDVTYHITVGQGKK